MKANETPEKIYLDPKKVEESEFGIIDAIVPEHRVEKGDIEYTRTDAFIKKACEWIKMIWSETDDRFKEDYTGMLIENFKKYMKGE